MSENMLKNMKSESKIGGKYVFLAEKSRKVRVRELKILKNLRELTKNIIQKS